MQSPEQLLIAAVAGALVGALVVWFVLRTRLQLAEARVGHLTAEVAAGRARVEQIQADRAQMTKEFRLLAHESLQRQQRSADEGAELRLRATERLMRPVADSLERFNLRLTEVEKERAALSADLAAQVAAVRATGDDLRRETASLATALRKPQVRGQWGELQLRRVVELAGMLEHCDFETQATTTSSDGRVIRPDLRVDLGEGRFVYVDAKVPLASFLDAHTATDATERAGHLRRFAGNVRTHVDQLGGKEYFKAGAGSPEFVVLFIPSEALAAEALTQSPDLHEYAAGRGVVLATPSTLIALLRTVAYGWRHAALAQSAAEVFTLGRELYDRLATLGGHVDKLGRSLTATVRDYNRALGSLETRVLVSGRRLRDLGVSEAELVSPQTVEEFPRPVTAPELTDAPGADPLPFESDADVASADVASAEPGAAVAEGSPAPGASTHQTPPQGPAAPPAECAG